MGKRKQESVHSVLITGLPNAGKTQIFNQLSGGYEVVANYPMTTIETALGEFRFLGQDYQLIDTPGVGTLSGKSEEGLLLRKIIAREEPDIILQCIDANRLRQSLFLTAELKELGLPMAITLNVVDETAKKGIHIDKDTLSRFIGCPVVETIAPEGMGMYDLKEALTKACNQGQGTVYQEELEEALQELSHTLPERFPFHRYLALMVLERDPFLKKIEFTEASYGKKKNRRLSTWDITSEEREVLEQKALALREGIRGDIPTLIRRSINAWIDELVSASVSRKKVSDKKWAERLAYASRHPLGGIVFLLLFLLITFYLVVTVAGFLTGAMETYLTEPLLTFIDAQLAPGFWEAFLIGDMGILTLGLFNAVVTVLPVLSVFYLMFGLMEDIGYLPNLTVLLRRGFQKIGLSGQAVMPIILGFGCKTVATLTTRSLQSRKEKLIAIYLIAFAIPCSAQLALNMAILGRTGVLSFIIAIVFLVLVEIIAGKILNRTIKGDGKQFFIQELPPFRVPIFHELLKKTGYRLYWFLKEAIPVFIFAAAVIFFFDFFGFLEGMRTFLRPLVVQWMGLPIEMVEAFILMIAREEAAAGLILRLASSGMLTQAQSIVAVVVTTMFIPCFANIVAMFKEAGAKNALLMLIGINVSTILLGGALNWLLLAFGM
ncbi:MAG: ferrous iron transport protein B [Spirochaetales bacterium]|nr:ferrous iron transport protein B [Spirochaetales bacterium]